MSFSTLEITYGSGSVTNSTSLTLSTSSYAEAVTFIQNIANNHGVFDDSHAWIPVYNILRVTVI